MPEEKDNALELLEVDVSPAVMSANSLEICDPETMEMSINVLGQLKSAFDKVETTRKFFTKPLLDQKKAIDKKFKPMLDDLKEAEGIIKTKMTDYRLTLPENAPPPKTEKAQDAKVTFVKVKKFKVVDETLIPRSYLTVDMTKIDKVVKAGLTNIPGIEIFEVEQARGSAL